MSDIIEQLKKHPKAYYSNDNGVLLCGDCMEIMRDMPDKCVDLCLTDPPYGLHRFKKKDGGNSKKIKSFGDKDTNWNNIKPKAEVFNAILNISQNSIIFGMNNFNLPPTEYFIVWDKGQKMPSFAECELAWTDCKIPAKIKYIRFEMNKKHPAQKPIELFSWLINNYGGECVVVFDPFGGSGTTAIACERLGRKWILIEREEKYCEIAAERIDAEFKQGKLF